MKLLFFLIPVIFQQDVPLKPTSEYELKTDFQFKQRPSSDKTAVYFDETKKDADRRNSSAVLPFMALQVTFLSLNVNEVKVKVVSNKSTVVQPKKIANGSVVRFNLGFTDDIKDRVTAHEYTIYLTDNTKSTISRIVIQFDEDGTYYVNNEKRGKI
jgi:hypothetical protein